MAQLDYASSGVDREAADRLVDKIAVLSKGTLNRKVKASVGGYASLFELDRKRWLAASTDGVGTKLKLASRLNEHRTIGVDLVAMSVNDLLCVGAEPLFFLDYFATGKLELGVAEAVIEGVAEGCRQARCALVGGETAEMPDMYAKGEYDLGGFAVGVVENPAARVLPRKDVKAGDAILGIASSGVHSNGFSLLRRLIPDGPAGDARARELLTPTKIYAKSLAPLIRARAFKGLAHITGSGFLNVPRISEKVSYELTLPKRSERPGIYSWIRQASGLSLSELATTFNLGIGMIAVVPAAKASSVLAKLKRAGETAWEMGEVTRKRAGQGCEVRVVDEGDSVVLKY